MNRREVLNLGLTAGVGAIVGAPCPAAVEPRPVDAQIRPIVPTALVDLFVHRIGDRVKEYCAGYQIAAASSPTGYIVPDYGGEARRPQDGYRAMLKTDRLNVASISKTLTAAALLHALRAKATSTMVLIDRFLPLSWKRGPNIDRIRIAHLLTHKSGFRADGIDYESLKAAVAQGVTLENMQAKPEYKNFNYALMRILLPRLMCMVPNEDIPGMAPGLYSAAYRTYCQRHVFTPAGVSNVQCKPQSSATSARCYHFPKTDEHGTDFGDMTLTNGSRGWHLSAEELVKVLRTLHLSDTILPTPYSDAMRKQRYGYDGYDTTPKGMGYCHKGGLYPGSMNPGEFKGYVMAFDNGIVLAVLLNSEFTGPDGLNGTILKAFDDTFFPPNAPRRFRLPPREQENLQLTN